MSKESRIVCSAASSWLPNTKAKRRQCSEGKKEECEEECSEWRKSGRERQKDAKMRMPQKSIDEYVGTDGGKETNRSEQVLKVCNVQFFPSSILGWPRETECHTVLAGSGHRSFLDSKSLACHPARGVPYPESTGTVFGPGRQEMTRGLVGRPTAS